MEPGLNSDIQIGNKNYHIQTEDWGREASLIVTKIFHQGAVVKTCKTTYQKALILNFSKNQSVRRALQTQHQKILDHLISGHIDK